MARALARGGSPGSVLARLLQLGVSHLEARAVLSAIGDLAAVALQRAR